MRNVESITGIVIRQALKSSNGTFTNSPDLIVTGVNAAFDTDSIVDPDAYDWYFSQAPVIGSANYVYVRGVNYTSTGTQKSRVYLYYVQSDQLLDPTKWQSSGFTVTGVAQNWVSIGATSQYQIVLADSPVMWTPPQPTTTGATYYLISWVDNSAQPQPPTFPTTPFASLAALGQYLQQNSSMALLDTIYRGAFIRQFPSQSVTQDGTGAQTSPDIIVNGQLAAQDASAWTTAASYNPGTLSQAAALGVRNFLYIRAINTVNGPVTARVFVYWATLGNIAPASWNPTNFNYAGSPQNWVDLTATTQNEVMISTVPLVWNAPSTASQTYVLIAYVDSSGSQKPPDFSAFGYVNAQAVTSFVAGHPQLAWLALTGTATKTPTLSWDIPLVAGTGISTAYAGVQLTKIPTDGTLSLSIPGPNAANTVVVSSMHVPDPNVLVAWPVTYPNHFASSAVLSYIAGPTPPPGGANILPVLVPQ